MTRRRARTSLRAGLLAAALAFGALQPAIALPVPEPQRPLVVGDDRGGGVLTRAREIRSLRRAGRDVRIVGKICYSTCTMLIGLETACVPPRTVFGFHGPARPGGELGAEEFERASRVIAAHYPPLIRALYMETARHTVRHVRGADLIALGMRPC